MKLNSKLILTFCLTIIVFGCSNQKDKLDEDKMMDEFMVFYDKFHEDPVYQIDHINFPLEGLPSGADTLIASNEKFYWQKDDWILHQSFDFENSEFNRQFIIYNEGLIAEKIVHNAGGLGMLRRFAKFGDEWSLIYYAAANKLKPKPQIFIE